LIEITALTKIYGAFAAVTELSFQVKAGEVLGLVGPNGAGKTTTLRCAVGIIPPTRGEIRIDGQSLHENPIEAKRLISFMPDEPRLFDYLTVMEHLQFTARIYAVGDFQRKAAELLEELELTEKRDAIVIACGLLHTPKALFFDEPLTGLDPLGIRRMKSTILRRANEGASIIISSHLLHLVEELCDSVLIIKGGRKVIHSSMDEILHGLPELKGDANLEEIFFRVTEAAESGKK
jgi:ABC-2 type transport system ATP-binding protein